MEWNKKNTIGIVEQLTELCERLQAVLPDIISEEEAKLRALEKIITKHNENLKKDSNG